MINNKSIEAHKILNMNNDEKLSLIIYLKNWLHEVYERDKDMISFERGEFRNWIKTLSENERKILAILELLITNNFSIARKEYE